ncbi:YbaL family putative K(+) efflux transporter [Sinorhizobium meliloti]|jgi:monovalent cation:H+ antiporter-2, CPA2 family|uniref:Potassium efflux protein n=1 Tax=Rhizobium meliloti (strain 1021) TaxID=266834 RepID=Q92YK4_RHIME|nr:YbaL family putative K(+) efflux transporter [Sinorhizobium meliloti]TWA95808.1 Kef-type potassium/proton antiporter (CPA2 family) [Ensifer sp. SEMIA 134]TWB31404.1 Kef-type potassium/proton antiporter (CPA2 family) [Ensifer sp. SEMIA 135]AAK65530.1 Potassium efflux protein [Sinorhizobium meliloti 1021]AEG07508.1 sodium/hydrogen exchanger [Sinorhizobium meliloti BL225C]AGG70567.1 Potassium efflux protein [Sinorhizobium meliloti 2011]
MPHTPLIATLVAGLGLAFILGTLANRLRLSPLVGYLLAGVLIGPFTPGFVADQALARQLAELGVILLMFGIGLHFSLHDLLSVRTIAVPGAFGQMALVTSLGFIVTQAIGWPIGAGLVFGLALSVASTVVVLRALQEKRQLETDGGRIAVGWLVVEDVAMILALVLLPAFADVLGGTANRAEPENSGMLTFFEPHTISGALGLTLAKLAAFFALMAIVGRRVIPAILHYVAHTGSRELFRLAVLAIALGVAFGAAELFGVSFALGAFFAGMILAESQLSQRAAQETLPLRDAFAVLFFVSVGMLFNPMILVEQPLLVAATFLIIVIGNAAAASAIAVMFGYSLPIAVTLGLSLAQIGEFSFILAGLGVELNLLPETGRDLVLAGAILSILINPLLFAGLDRLMPRLENRAPVRTEEEGRIDITPKLTTTSLTDHAILVGYGRVGRLVAETLQNAGQPYLIVEERQVVADQLRAGGVDVISGNAAQPGLLEAANVNSAKWLISAIPNPFESGNFIEHARATNPKLEIIARAHSDAEVEYLKRLGANLIIMGEKEIARSISEHILSNINAPDTTTPSDSESRLTSE